MNDLENWLSDSAILSRKSASELVFEELRNLILSGRFAEGSKLPSEAKLAAKYGVSRPIVREALRSLQILGLTETRTGSGTYVLAAGGGDIRYGDYSARDLMEARPFVEVSAAGWAALRRDDDELSRLLGLCDRMEQEEDTEAWVRLDSDFHGLIAEASKNAVFRDIVDDVREAMAQQSGLLTVLGPRRQESNEEHRAIVEAIRRGSEAEARAAMEIHLKQVEAAVSRIIGSEQR
ncbi:DNA-binding FadR family transcriptional regulator [Rhizobium leguminosarum]|uniref:DNA-binding FadR family transcriptional regulator n=2 Tax=Rhizobium leguminosarum TaxID=384 RepID=A0A7Z0E323_RHILE|nr:FadR/GntR family transcriptional regulator [Rhizobium leguminosarum]ACI58929.1 GntR domain protein [Rhizobium leguminosarum bv. trifolii WSM2304]MBB5667620.1 DNA-binding FadR family transcriptional regulator [Rhizobium leguminosarum]MBB6221239.1 DNA-binding FadR family transcriptional regulator [Rhizobium leguminosarum]NYJ13951.1 DNA-binding FadR family transcriptional regulator [Rhizobium leguminosarum]